MSQTKVAVGMLSATGTPGSGNFLRGDGTWNAPAAGLTFISSTDISAAATYDFTSFTAGSYEHYMFVLQNLLPATNDVHLYVRTSTDGGSSYDDGASDYTWGGNALAAGDYDLADAQLSLTGDNSSSYSVGNATNAVGVCGTIMLYAPHATAVTMVSGDLRYADGGDVSYIQANFGGHRLSAADVDGFRIYFESGNITSGTITAYGLANA